MNDLERKQKEVELMKVQAAKADYELQILRRLQDVDRIKADIENQEKRIIELKGELDGKKES